MSVEEGVSTNIDIAGGLLIASQSSVTISGDDIIVNGDHVTPHGLPPHNDATMIASQTSVSINGIDVIKSGDSATCGHIASGSNKVSIG